MAEPESSSHTGTEGGVDVKNRLRNWIKLWFGRTEPLLEHVWFGFKYVEIFWVYPLMLAFPPRIAWKIFGMRVPWLLLKPSKKRLILGNLADGAGPTMLPEKTARLARRHALFLSSIRFETQFLRTCSVEQVDDTVGFEGLSLVDEALAERKGVVLLGCHSGCFYRAIFASARRGYKLHVVTMQPEDARQGIWQDKVGSILYKKLMDKLEAEPNVKLQYVGGSLRGVPRALRRGEIVCATLDVPVEQEEARTPRVNFLGRECSFSSQLIRLAVKLGAVCLPYVTHGEDEHCFIKIHGRWVQGENEGAEETRIEDEMKYVFRILEGHILAHPEQWWLWNDLGGFGPPASGQAHTPPIEDV